MSWPKVTVKSPVVLPAATSQYLLDVAEGTL